MTFAGRPQQFAAVVSGCWSVPSPAGNHQGVRNLYGDLEKLMQQDFDFIVVGGGSAGCALASRLSEESSVAVLLIEAGGDTNPWQVRMPLAVDQLLTSTKYNWGFESVSEPGLGGRKIEHPRGKVMGGSSSINGMVYTRGNPQDYDEWRDEHGCDGWGYADVLPYFKRIESAPKGDSRYRGRSGPMQITIPNYKSNPLNVAFMNAGRALGYPISEDGNGPQHEGFHASEQTIINGQRNSTAAAYLTPSVRARKNLAISAETLVERVVFEGKRAVGVACNRNQQKVTFKARNEIILCAGGVGTPHILKLSGIGPSEELAKHGIPLVHENAAVGANLQDHLDLPVQFRCKERVTLRKNANWPGRIPVGISWFLFKRGIAASNQFEVAAYLRSRPGISKPNLKLEFFPLAISHSDFKPYPMDAFQIHTTVETSHARGTITLQSSDPKERPELRFNYLSDERDMQTFREGISIVRELVASQPFDRFRGAEIEPGEAANSREALDEWIRKRATTAFHVSSTCTMGRNDNPKAVVGPDLKVHGVEGLRVADASIMPVVVTSNLNATTIMIGDRAADLCLNRSLLSPSNEPYWVHPSWATMQR
jgi:choline dehydrogenase